MCAMDKKKNECDASDQKNKMFGIMSGNFSDSG